MNMMHSVLLKELVEELSFEILHKATDYEKIRLVLGDNQKKDDKDKFILAVKTDQSDLFGSADIGLDDGFTYEINSEAFLNPDAYRMI